MTLEEIKLRRLNGQHLLAPADTQTVVKDLCGVQAQFMSHALHALTIRCDTVDTSALLKNWTLRGTAHLFAMDDLPLFIRPETYRLNDWTIPTWWNQRSDWSLTPERQKYFSEIIRAALADGPLGRDELKAVCRAQNMTEAEEASMFDPWGGGIRELCERGFLHYAPQEQKVFCLTPEFTPMAKEDADLELARRYFTHFGPATVKDAAYFFGTTQAKVKSWLKQLPVSETTLDGRSYFYIDQGLPTGDLPDCQFLAGFDQLMLGYEKTESLFLPRDHMRQIFNLAGIVRPAILVNGTVAGWWNLKNHKLKVTLFSPLDQELLTNAATKLWGDLKEIEVL